MGNCHEGTRQEFGPGSSGHRHGKLFEKTCFHRGARAPPEEGPHCVVQRRQEVSIDQVSLRVIHHTTDGIAFLIQADAETALRLCPRGATSELHGKEGTEVI